MDLKDIKAIIDLMKKNSVSEFELERQDFKIRLKRGSGQPLGSEDMPPAYVVQTAAPSALGGSGTSPGQGARESSASGESKTSGDAEIHSPMIGTFYRAPSPESENYIEVGSEVNPDTVVCIIEAMKVMNEIKAEMKGVITEILVDNAKPVEFGQPLFKIRPA